MYCPKCKNKTKVTDSRPMENKNGIMRRRRCVVCGHNFQTYEEYESSQAIAENAGLRALLKKVTEVGDLARSIRAKEVADG